MKRYSLRTASVVLNINYQTILNRAKALGMDTSAGLTAEQVKRVADYKGKDPKRQRRNSAEELRAELEAMG